MTKNNLIKKIYWTLGAVISIVAYNNCGEGFVAQSLGGGAGSGGSVLFSRAPGESCEDALLKVYKNTYHPFLTQTCNSCHVSGGGGNGVFAENDPSISYNSFASKGATLINSQSIGSHKPPYTGPQNQARITEISSYWGKAQTDYVSCASQSGNTTPGTASVVKSAGKTVSATLATTFVRMEWDLETLSDAKVPVIAGIEIRKAVLGGETKGYEFRNPTLRLKNAAAGPHAMRALNIYINNQLQSEITTYSNIDTIISTTNDTNIAVGYANAMTVITPATTDMISLEFSNLKSTSGTTTPGATPTPTPGATPTPTPVGAVTFTQLVAAGGIFANSCIGCHNANNAAGGLNLAVYANAKNAAANIRTRVNNAANPMPTGGLLPQAQRDRINAWVDQGAPQ